MVNDYWKTLIPGAKGPIPTMNDVSIEKYEEALRNSGTIGTVISDSARKILGRESYYEQEAREENEKYWADYAKNTGINPEDIKYPIKTGSAWNHPIQSVPVLGAITRPMKMLYGGMK